ncbi:DUF3089 domain-containing protein [Henriciella sp.]|uniref:DUF3089 domain-containing protein n=1 Tax=Henriciella sp. TaxID=1968823 RepID=UPI002624EFB7|nr:DUF3089 domain-containing protein [Henriciella sp.]
MRLLSVTALVSALLIGACGEPADETGDVEAASPPPAEADETSGADGEAAADQTATQPADYNDMANWLCHPGKEGDACEKDLSYTVVQADGSTEVKSFEPAENPPIDCFYVYPTISFDTTPNSDLEAGGEENRVAATQFGAFAETCRLFAPVYRQVTLTHLQSLMRGGEYTADAELAYGDVKAAWDTYLDKENNGRGVVLIGHSQGARMIEQLLRQDVLGSTEEDLVVSAMPIGYTVYGDAETGNLGSLEPCTTAGQTGCVISYVSFRADSPPPAESRFGVNDPDGRRALCINPAELSGDDGELDARLSRAGFFGLDNTSFIEGETIETDYAALPGMLSAECVETDAHTYLAVQVDGDTADPRADDIVGDVVVEGEVLGDWGLHLIDMNVAMGNLVTIVSEQAETWTAAQAANEAE